MRTSENITLTVGGVAQGVDIVYESVGGDMFKTCLGALAKNGRLVVIGMMSQYGSGWKPSQVIPYESEVQHLVLPLTCLCQSPEHRHDEHCIGQAD